MMKRTPATGIVLSIAAVLALITVDGQEPAGVTDQLKKTTWLAGCWEARSASRLIEEQWMLPRGGTMLGMGRTIKGDKLADYEHTRIFSRDGKLVYRSIPSGQQPAEFVSISVADTLLVFENLAHDFPQRIIYRRRGADSLIARIEGPGRNETMRIDFPYARTACANARATSKNQ
jgi:hypothetical protein